jgi:hypothetical protein
MDMPDPKSIAVMPERGVDESDGRMMVPRDDFNLVLLTNGKGLSLQPKRITGDVEVVEIKSSSHDALSSVDVESDSPMGWCTRLTAARSQLPCCTVV